jgi:Flp pilus assembly protein TadD
VTKRIAWVAGTTAVVACGMVGIIILKVSQAHGLVHAAEGGNVERVRAAVERAPNDAGLWALLGEAYSKRTDYGQAVQAYQRAIQLDATDETTWWMMGIAEVCRKNLQGVAAAEAGLRRLNARSAQDAARSEAVPSSEGAVEQGDEADER